MAIIEGLLNNIPHELRERSQWCVCYTGTNRKDLDKIPMFWDMAKNCLSYSSPTDRSTWHDFNTAVQIARYYGLAIGYVLDESDPYVVVDLDVKDATNEVEPAKWTTAAEIQGFVNLYTRMETYTEISSSGKGVHIWAKGNLPSGARRGHVEIYPKQRFMIVTGNVIVNLPINERQDFCEAVYNEVNSGRKYDNNYVLQEFEAQLSDDEVFNRAQNSVNGERFIALWRGDWQNLGFPSQSEADIALITFLSFHTRSNDQVRRMFLMSELGNREKAKRAGYVERTLNHARQLNEKDELAEKAKITQNLQYAKHLVENLLTEKRAKEATNVVTQPATPVGVQLNLNKGVIHKLECEGKISVPELREALPPEIKSVAPEVQYSPNEMDSTDADRTALYAITHQNIPTEYVPWNTFPPGRIGEIAKVIHSMAAYPNITIANTAAFGLMVGMVSRCFSVFGSGLNMYIALVAKSGLGKEAMHDGVAKLIGALGTYDGNSSILMGNVDFADYKSGAALMKTLSDRRCIMNIQSEFGKLLGRMGDRSGDAAAQSIRTAHTQLFQKSGRHSQIGSMAYSDKNNNSSGGKGLCFSTMGESTPATFYEAVSSGMLEDGYISRWWTIETLEKKPPFNFDKENVVIPDGLQAWVGRLAGFVLEVDKYNDVVECELTPRAKRMFSMFESRCREYTNSLSEYDEANNQLWGRAPLKALKIAALVAIGNTESFDHTVRRQNIASDAMEYGINCVVRDIGTYTRRIAAGEIGCTDAGREAQVLNFIKHWISNASANKGTMQDLDRTIAINFAGIPRDELVKWASGIRIFSVGNRGSTKLLEDTLNSMHRSGLINAHKLSSIREIGRASGVDIPGSRANRNYICLTGEDGSEWK